MSKETSYQKLKRKNYELEQRIWALRSFIAKSNDAELEMVRKLFEVEESLLSAWWRGEVSVDNNYNGILSLINEDRTTIHS